MKKIKEKWIMVEGMEIGMWDFDKEEKEKKKWKKGKIKIGEV